MSYEQQVWRDSDGTVYLNDGRENRALEMTEEPSWRRLSLTHAKRMPVPFVVDTPHGRVVCADGWLAIDAHGDPYPISAAEFEKNYEPALPVGEPSVVERIAELEADLRAKQAAGWGDPRELALALTALEDCQMRATRARAKTLGVFRPVDLERLEAAAERERFEAEASAAERG